MQVKDKMSEPILKLPFSINSTVIMDATSRSIALVCERQSCAEIIHRVNAHDDLISLCKDLLIEFETGYIANPSMRAEHRRTKYQNRLITLLKAAERKI